MNVQLMMARARMNHQPPGGDPSLRGCFAKWNMEDAIGSTVALDSSGNGYNLTIQGTPTFGNTSVLPSGRGTSLALTSGQWLNLPAGFITQLTPPFSIVLFVRFANISGTQQIFCSARGGINWYINNGVMTIGIAGVTNNATDTRTQVANVNYMLALTCNTAGGITFYVNKVAGTLHASVISTSASGTDPARIGDYPGDSGKYPIKGDVQRYALCDVELSSAELSEFYDSL